MYYYDLKLALYTTENIDLPTDFFGEFPHIDTEKTKYLENYNHPVPFQDRPRRSAPKSVTTHTRESIPPTPIHSAKHHIHNCLNERVDFRLGPVELTAFDVHTKTSSKKKKRELTEKNYSLGYGVFHLYRSLEQISEQDLPDTKIAKDESLNISHSQDDGTLVCILAVPSYMSHQDYINSLGPSNASIVSYRFIRDYSPNKYTVLLQFKDRKSAFAFHQKFNGRRFNMTEPEISHVVYIRSNTIKCSLLTPKAYPYLDETLSQDIERTQSLLSNNDKDSRIELPTCPVCLERMDEGVTGLLGIECQHTSGCHCLNKWGENSCVVCRSCQKPVLEGRNRHFDHQKYIKHDQCECFECGYFDNLWICMICGHIGCGRYQEAHAYDHYLETNHVFTLEIETQTVWDYFGDGYVHRLIQNTIDGALDELPSSSSKMVRHSGQEQNRQSSTSNDANGGDQAKIDHISVEYTYMLTTQLDSQRLYYEEQSDILTEQLSVLTAEMDNLAVENVQAKEEHLQLVNENHRIESYKADLVKYTERLDKRIISYKDKHQSIEKNLNEERLLTKSLLKNNELLNKEAEKKEKDLNALTNQVQELMARLENRESASSNNKSV